MTTSIDDTTTAPHMFWLTYTDGMVKKYHSHDVGIDMDIKNTLIQARSLRARLLLWRLDIRLV